jgi:hypothetical protein
VDIYRDILPRTNCGDCGFATCLAFAAKVVSEQLPLETCPHIDPQVLSSAREQLLEQYASGKWLKRDTAADALAWARERSASMALESLPDRIGGELTEHGGQQVLKLPYFNDAILVSPGGVTRRDGSELSRWEQVFVYNHLAQGGASEPAGEWKDFSQFPNTVSKVKSMAAHVEKPLAERFASRPEALLRAGLELGAEDRTGRFSSADLALAFVPLPRVPLLLLFWDGDPEEGFDPEVKVLFDATGPEHLDIESMLFLCERLVELLLETDSSP